MPTILDTLKQEHDELRGLFARLKATPDEAEDERRELMHRMEEVLIPHAKWEETTFLSHADKAACGAMRVHAEETAMPTILDTLKQEHDELRGLFARLKATPDEAEDERRELMHRMEEVLIPHAKWEETTFYPALSERATHEQQVLEAEAMTEHRAVEKAVLPDLHAADLDSRQFAGTVRALTDLIEHHAQEEETQIFAAMRQLYSNEELVDLDRQYADWKDSAAAAAITTHAKIKTAATSALRSPGSPG